MKRVYAVRYHTPWLEKYEKDDDLVWTISEDTNEPGWETDAGCHGYGLPKKLAEEYVQLINMGRGLLTDEEFITNAEAQMSEEIESLRKRVAELWEWVQRRDGPTANVIDFELGCAATFDAIENKMKELGLDAVPLGKGE